MTQAQLTVLAGPTAVGKGTVVAALLKRYPHLRVSVSATTRNPRPGELDGVHYYFVSPSEFDSMIERGEMLEWALVHGKNKYGTPRGPVDTALAAGEPVLLEIDLAGARQVRANRPDAQFIFLAPPSWEELERRLVGRGTEGPEERERRLATARVEVEAASEFDHVVINDDVDRAVSELAGLIGLE
ncbi:guanylate kinase [Actinomyces sp. ICM47]|uniref:guanylate kinase n=1 Tax=Actinomyces sp. ICM47 TaxID=936548 RepID=UPI0002733318|nr:guanylate kinase [Actinomyces sp. ICM47]EJG15198.1 guanylate kinase [Actinomyces sp. ICM47]